MRLHASAEDDDVQILHRAVRGDERAFAQVVDRHGPYLFGIARTLLTNTADAEDAVQETLAAMLGGSYRGDASPRTWLVSILVRQAALIRRKQARWKQETRQPLPEPAGSFQQAVDARADLAVMLEKLSEEHRQVLILRELQQMSYDQIARVLHVPRGTVESRLHRAREQLKALFLSDDRT